MKWIQKGDLDGFFGLGLNNFINLLLIINLSQFVLGFSMELIAMQILPGMAMGLCGGNFFYAWQARKLALDTGRNDVCAIPYGINLLPIFFYTFYVMLPAQQIALSSGMTKEEADIIAWQAGILAGIGSGVIEVIGSFFVHYLRKVTPRAALLAALAVIGIFFIAGDYFFRTYAYPLIGIPTLLLTLYFYYGGVRLRGNIPGGLIVLLVGIALAWGTHKMGFVSPVKDLGKSALTVGLYLPSFSGLGALLNLDMMITYASVILPMGLINVVGSVQAIESAAAAGDDFPPRQTLMVNGLGSILASVLGSPFPTTIYIGHSGWKGIGARSGYSLINGVVMAVLCLTGTIGYLSEFIPIEAGMAILIWIGFTIGAQAFQAVPREHAPAVIAGLIPGIGAFSTLIIKRCLGAVGYGTEANPYSIELFRDVMTKNNLFAEGVFALEQGWLYSSIVLTATMVAIIDKKLPAALGWLFSGAVLSGVGIIHHYKILDSDITTQFGPNWEMVGGYALAASCVLFVKILVVKKD